MLTDEITRFAAYYGFAVNTCNARKGNEKGHVENSGKCVRRDLFSLRYEFEDERELKDYVADAMSRENADCSGDCQGKGRAPPASAGEILRRRIRRGQSEYLFLRLRQRQLLFGPGNLRGAQARMVDNRGESRDFPRGRRRRQARPSEGPRRVFGSDRALHRNASEEARGDPPLAGAGAMPGRHHRRVQGEIRRGSPGIPRLHPKGGGGGRSPRLRNGGGCREGSNQDDRRFDNG